LHVGKAEIDLPEGTDPYDAAVYAKARDNLDRMRAAGLMIRDEAPSYYVYRLTDGDHVQTGLVATASIAEYRAGRILKHEHTTPAKEDDRVRHIEAVNAQTGPVMTAYPDAPGLDRLIAAAAAGTPDNDAVADDGVRHQLWVVRDWATINAITAAGDRLRALYIADGHHRSAAAERVAAARGGGADASHNGFLVVAFPARELRILDYNRVVKDLNGLTPEAFLDEARKVFTIEPADGPAKPDRPGQFGLFVAGGWYRLSIDPKCVPADPVKRLDVSLLADHLLEPLLGIADQRRDPRIAFVGGARGLGELERRVRSGEMAAAFALYPTRMADLMAVADAGKIMPPKSTWFEPKLADGLIAHVLD
jgi:uncharacterized protein (DUF1015 family)